MMMSPVSHSLSSSLITSKAVSTSIAEHVKPRASKSSDQFFTSKVSHSETRRCTRLVAALRELNGLGEPADSTDARTSQYPAKMPATTTLTAATRLPQKLSSPRTPSKTSRSIPNLLPVVARCTKDRSTSKQNNRLAALKHKERVYLQIPQKLPAPHLRPNSSPHEDLVGHLFRHNLLEEARTAYDTDMPATYLLSSFLRLGQSGPSDFFQRTQRFLNDHQLAISKSLRPGAVTPESVSIDISEESLHSQPIPTHLLAVYSSEEAATVFAVHGLVLSLQCVSIPFLPRSNTTLVDGQEMRDLPIVSLCIPHPQHFGAMMRWFYTQSSTALSQELLPLEHIIRYLAARSLTHREQGQSSKSADVLSYSTSDLVEALAVLPTKRLLTALQKIQAFWKNGVALGVLAPAFWVQLDKSWDLIISAVVLAKCQRKGLQTSDSTDSLHP